MNGTGATILLILGLVAAVTSWVVLRACRKLEENRRHEEWLESYFAKVRADQACRDRLGKFIPATQRKADLSREEAGYIKKHGDKL